MSTTNYTEIADLIRACAGAKIKSLKLPCGTSMNFYDNDVKLTIADNTIQPDMFATLDTVEDMEDNSTVQEDNADKDTSIASLEDELENLQLTDPLLYEAKIKELLQQDANDTNK